MTDKHSHENIKELFSEALELSPDERAGFLDELCGDAPELRREIESLLAAFEKSEDFIEKPAARIEGVLPHGNSLEKVVGNYRIIREIGQGGMGAVYLAARDDGEFEKNVAVKLSRQTIADGESIRRFLAERQILAKLQHPNIATLIDGGLTEDGQPFLAMEFIDGVSITDFCRQNELSVRERLKLFLKVCRAVAYAHRNLIVHRDIKPSNILVSGDGEPKLLDFGLARLTDAGAETDRTKTIFRALTPAYASPEQLLGRSITTASDIYSLGVVLYEMLTDSRPFATDNRSLDEVIGTVVNSEPRTPSSIPSASARRSQLLKGDIDNVILLALRKEPERRYASVEDFARDIENCLDGRPVSARPNTLSYRTAKFVRRNRVAVTAGFLVFAALVGGLAVSLYQTRIANETRALAERESAKSKKITAFMEKILNFANPAWYAEGRSTGGEAKLSEVLDELAEKIETEFPDDPDVQAELHHKYAEIYLSRNLNEKGLFHAERALTVRRRYFGERHAEVAKDLYYLSAANQRLGRVTTSFKLSEEAIAMFREVDPDNRNLPYLLENHGEVLSDDYRDPAAAIAFFRQALELFRRHDGEKHYNTIRQYFNLAVVLAETRDTGPAEEFFKRGESLIAELPDENLRDAITEYRVRFEAAKGNLSVAIGILKGRIDSIPQNAGSTASVGKTILILKTILEDKQDFAARSEVTRKQIAIALRSIAANDPGMGILYADLANDLLRAGREVEGRAVLQKALSMYETIPGADGAKYQSSLGEGLYHQNRFSEALPFLRATAAFYRANVPPNRRSREIFEMLDKTEANLKESSHGF
ncbi:MAG: serine/threonine protein kinase [Acidobacteria bacterium]|nr:serine/threonine protein kinase [Acidobacteriota bacterium]